MARPRKTGLDYFSLDVDILNDIKIKKLTRRNGGGRALSVYIALLCQIYYNGYFFEYDKDTAFLLSDDLHEEEEFVEDIIKACVEIGLFDADVFDGHSVLTSKSIQERYKYVCKLSKRKVVMEKYNLLSENSKSTEKTEVNSEETKVNTEETPDNSDKTRKKRKKPKKKTEETPDNLSENALKEKESKVNNFKVSTTASTPTYAHEEKINFGGKIEETPLPAPVKQTLGEEIAALKEDTDWCHSTACYLCIPPNSLFQYLDRFGKSCEILCKTRHVSLDDCKQHFVNWFNKESSQQQSRKLLLQRSSFSAKRPEPIREGVTEADFAEGFK